MNQKGYNGNRQSYNSRYGSRRNNRAAKRWNARGGRSNPRLLYLIAALLILAAIIAACVLLPRGCSGKDTPVQADNSPAPTEMITATPETETPTPEPTVSPEEIAAAYEQTTAYLRPTALAEGLLPVFISANTAEKRVAITVDDCFQPENLSQIIDLAEQYGAKLTLLPLGRTVDVCAEQLKRAYALGYEIENHTLDHVFLYGMSDEDMAFQIAGQQQKLSRVLGVEYEFHFFRPKGGNGKEDPRMHAYLDQLGYKGIAHWSLSGTAGVQAVLTGVKPGDVILYHTTDADLKKLSQVIPELSRMGYQMVTLNELFGYTENAVSPELSEASQKSVIPLLTQAYDDSNVILKKGVRMYAVYKLQSRLYELGYLAENLVDGDFGELTEKALEMFQTQAGLKADGECGAGTRQAIAPADAPRNPGAPVEKAPEK